MEILRHVSIDDEFIDRAPNYFEIIAPAWDAINIYGSETEYKDSLAKLSAGQVHLVTTTWHISEVLNGGHYQFFTNSTGIVWRDARAAYKILGLDDLAAILQDAADKYGGNLSLDRDERETFIDSKDFDLADLDKRFFPIYESGRIDEAMMRYIWDHRAEFYFEGDITDYSLPGVAVG